jgi:CubicO group peptidase (beta-lactamase class C family)
MAVLAGCTGGDEDWVVPGDGPLAEVVDGIFEPYSAPQSPGAIIAVVKDGKPLLLKGYGSANRESAFCEASNVIRRVTAGEPGLALLGMTSTLNPPDLRLVFDNQATTYLVWEGETVPYRFDFPYEVSGDGSLISTLDDLLRWVEGLFVDDESGLFLESLPAGELSPATRAWSSSSAPVR